MFLFFVDAVLDVAFVVVVAAAADAAVVTTRPINIYIYMERYSQGEIRPKESQTYK